VLKFLCGTKEVDEAALLIAGIVFLLTILEIEDHLTEVRKPLRVTFISELLDSSDLDLVAILVILLLEVEDETGCTCILGFEVIIIKPVLEEDVLLELLVELLIVMFVLSLQTGCSTSRDELDLVVEVDISDVDVENLVVDVLITDVEVLTYEVLVDVVLVEMTGLESLILVVLVLTGVDEVETDLGVLELLMGSTGFLSLVELQHMPRNSLLREPKKLLLLSRFLFFFSFGHLAGSSRVL